MTHIASTLWESQFYKAVIELLAAERRIDPIFCCWIQHFPVLWTWASAIKKWGESFSLAAADSIARLENYESQNSLYSWYCPPIHSVPMSATENVGREERRRVRDDCLQCIFSILCFWSWQCYLMQSGGVLAVPHGASRFLAPKLACSHRIFEGGDNWTL